MAARSGSKLENRVHPTVSFGPLERAAPASGLVRLLRVLRQLCRSDAGWVIQVMATEDINLHIGRRLTTRRLSLGLSLAEVAQKCGVTLQQIHRYETGANSISVSMLWSLSRCLGVDIAYFFEGLSTDET